MTSPPPGAPSAEAPSTAARILDAAEALFAERGFAGTSVRDIAGQVGVNQASIYNHFSSKQALYEAVLDRGFRAIADLLAEAARQGFSSDVTEQVGDRIADELWLRPRLPKLLQREVLDNGEYLDRLTRNWLRPIYEKGLAALEAGARKEDWDENERVLLLFGFYHLVFGHFTSSALVQQLGGIDPFSEEIHRIHLRFLRKVSQRLLGLGSVDENPGGTPASDPRTKPGD